MSYDVYALPSARGDIDAIFNYYLKQNPQSAVDFVDDIDRAMERLSQFPESAPITCDEQMARECFRVLVLKFGHLLFYKFAADAVYVYRIIDGRRNYGAFI